MNFYQIEINDTDTELTKSVEYAPTMGDAKQTIKTQLEQFPESWEYITVRLVDILTDKASINALLNDEGPSGISIIKTWLVTKRGGLKRDIHNEAGVE